MAHRLILRKEIKVFPGKRDIEGFQRILISSEPFPVAGHRRLLIAEKSDVTVSETEQIGYQLKGPFIILQADIIICFHIFKTGINKNKGLIDFC